MFVKAQRQQARLRLALCGPSGSGKTYSALQIARGLAPEGQIAMIDTERGSGALYADLAAYDIAPISPPFSPKRYIELIAAAAAAGYQVLIIDSLSHAWTGEGGVLDMHDKAAAASPNRFSAWREVTPQHNALVDAILGADLHVIVTLRTKTAYEVVDNSKGKKTPVKIGLAPVQRDGMEYEFTLVLDLSVEGHVATATKDRTRLFDGLHFIPTPETGATLAEWLQGDAEASAAQARRLKAYLRRELERTGLTPKAPDLALALRKNPPSVRIDDEARLPADYLETITSTRARKQALLEALKAGETIPGAQLRQSTRLVIR